MTAWNVNTSVHIQSVPVDASSNNPLGVFIGGDPSGSKLYHFDFSDNFIYEYDMSTPYDISTMILNQKVTMPKPTAPPNGASLSNIGMWFTDDGGRILWNSSNVIHTMDLPTAWDVSSGTFGDVFGVDWKFINEAPFSNFQLDSAMRGMYIQPDGLAIHYVGLGSSSQGSSDRVYKQTMTIPFDITTLAFCVFNGSFHVTENQPVGIFWRDNGLTLYVLGNDNTTISSDSVIWQYPVSSPFSPTSTSTPTEFDITAEDSAPGPGIYFLNVPHPNAGARYWVTGRTADIIEEWSMPIDGVEKEFTVNAILTLEFIEIEVNALVRNRFEKEFFIGARLVVFCDYIDTNAGWTINNAGGLIFVDDPAFPDRIHFERVPSGGGAIRRWVTKDSGRPVSGDVKFEFKFDFLDDNPVLNFSGGCSVLLADSINHDAEATAVGRSYIGFSLARVRSEGRHIFFGRVSDGTTTVTTIEGGSQNQHTHEVYKQTSGGTDIQKGPYYCTIELKDNLLRTSIYLDSARTQHMRGSPREADATGIIPTSLRHLTLSNPLGGGGAREITADFDEFCFTQNEPLKIIPKKPFPAVGQFTEGWETYTLGDQNPDDWTSFNNLLGASATVDIDIREVSNELPEEGTQTFKQHFKHTQNAGGNTTAQAFVQKVAGPAIANTDGSGIDLARFLTARQRADILTGGFNGRASGVTVTFSTLSGGPGIGTMAFTLFGAGNLLGSNSGRLNLNAPIGTYAGFERFDLKSLLDTDSFLSNNQGVDWENHVKSVTIRFGSQTRSDGTGQIGESLVNNDYMSLWGTKLETFLVDAVLKVVDKEHEFIVGKLIALPPNVVQIETKIGKLLKALGDNGDCNNQQKCYEINAIIVLREDELFFSTTHLQDIVPLFSEEAPLIQDHEFKVSAVVVIRQTQNGFVVSKLLQRLGDNLCVGETGIFFQDNFNGDGNGSGNIGWDINDFRIRIDIFGNDDIFRIVDLQSTQLPTGIARAVKAFQKPQSPDIDFMWEFKHVHFRGKDDPSPFASQIQMTLKETSNDIIPGFNADETTIKYRTDRVTSTGPEGIRLEVFDKNAVNSVISPNAMTIHDLGLTGFTFYPRITKTGNTIKLEMFIDEERTTLAFIGVEGGLISGVPVVEVDVTGFDFSQDLGFIWIGNYAGGGPAIRANEEFDDIFVFNSKCPRFDVNALLRKTDIEEFKVKALLKGPRQVDTEVKAILKALGDNGSCTVGQGTQRFCAEVDAFIGEVNKVETEVHVLLKKQGDNGFCTLGQGTQQFCSQTDALIQQQGIITPESQPIVDAILIVASIIKDEEFRVDAVIGIGEGFESILDVESVIGSKTGSQT